MKKLFVIIATLGILLLFISCKNSGYVTDNDVVVTSNMNHTQDSLSMNYGRSKIGITILLPLNGMDCALNGRMLCQDEWKKYFHSGRYTLVYFINNKKCSICLMKMLFWWDNFADELGRNDIDYCFIVHPDQMYSLEELVCELNRVYFSFPVFFDFNALFINANECYATLQMPDCVLLNREKQIVAIGNMDDPEKLYNDFKSSIL